MCPYDERLVLPVIKLELEKQYGVIFNKFDLDCEKKEIVVDVIFPSCDEILEESEMFRIVKKCIETPGYNLVMTYNKMEE